MSVDTCCLSDRLSVENLTPPGCFLYGRSNPPTPLSLSGAVKWSSPSLAVLQLFSLPTSGTVQRSGSSFSFLPSQFQRGLELLALSVCIPLLLAVKPDSESDCLPSLGVVKR